MPPATKRRKISATAVHSLTAPASQRGIQAFGKISKSRVQDNAKGVLGKKDTGTHSKDVHRAENKNKRKLGIIGSPTDEEEGEKESRRATQAPPIDESNSRPTQSLVETPSASTQTRTPRKKALLRSKYVDTPTQGARSCLQSLALASSSSSPSSNSSSLSRTTRHETPPSSPGYAESESPQHPESHQLPDELQDLVSLHSSFLIALSLHHAHNGSTTPADLRTLGPSIERVWRKRRVTSHDVRMILAIGRPERAAGYESAGLLYLSGYGDGKVCVEVADHSDSRAATRRPINDQLLNSTFLRSLEQRWTCYKTQNPADPSPSNFLASLPLLPVTPCTSLSKLTPLLSKGQRRLEDLKAGAIKAQQKPLSPTSANTINPSQPKTKQPSARSTDLFQRLKAKQLHQSTLPLPPSAGTLARKSALQRLREITPVLESLASSSKRHANDDAAVVDTRSAAFPVSFTMPTLVQHLQMSLRNPIGKEEVIRCVRMLAEIVPEWVGLKEVGKVLAVTIKGAGLKKDELEKRIGSSLEKL